MPFIARSHGGKRKGIKLSSRIIIRAVTKMKTVSLDF